MKIQRNDMNVELTDAELADAHKEFVMNYMKKAFEEDFNYDSEKATELASQSYELYKDNDFLANTMFESVEQIAKKQSQEYTVAIAVNGQIDIKIMAHNPKTAMINALEYVPHEPMGGLKCINYDAVNVKDKDGNITDCKDL